MSRNEDRAGRDADLEKVRARYGLFAVIASNLAIAVVAISASGSSTGTRA